MANTKRETLYVCNGDSLGDRRNIMPASYEVEGDTLFKIREAISPQIARWRDAAPNLDLNELLASVYLQGVLDCGLMHKLKRTK